MFSVHLIIIDHQYCLDAALLQDLLGRLVILHLEDEQY